jgi:hypothetical protein
VAGISLTRARAEIAPIEDDFSARGRYFAHGRYFAPGDDACAKSGA